MAGHLSVTRGTALYIGALMGPGVLLIPALAVEAAGPASILAWGALLLLSAPLAITFSALGVRHPVAGGVAVYVREGIGSRASVATGFCFLLAVALGSPAVAVIGGNYVADAAGGGMPVAVATGAGMLAFVGAANALGLRVSSTVQLGLSGILVVVLTLATATALPGHIRHHWEPFAPHGWWSVGTAATLLIWLFIGWEAMAQLAGEFRDPARDLPRAVGWAFATISLLYASLAVSTVTVGAGHSDVPLADLLAVGFGSAGRHATVALAVVFSMGTVNVYFAGAANLATALAEEGALPAWLRRRPGQPPRRPLVVIMCTGGVVLTGIVAHLLRVDYLVRSTTACFVVVYLLSLTAAVRMLGGGVRVAAVSALGMVLGIAVFAGASLIVPGIACLAAWLVGRFRPATSLRVPSSASVDPLADIDPSARGILTPDGAGDTPDSRPASRPR